MKKLFRRYIHFIIFRNYFFSIIQSSFLLLRGIIFNKKLYTLNIFKCFNNNPFIFGI